MVDIVDLYIFNLNFQTDGSVLRKRFLFKSAQGCGAGRQRFCSALRKRKSSSGGRGTGEGKTSSQRKIVPFLLAQGTKLKDVQNKTKNQKHNDHLKIPSR